MTASTSRCERCSRASSSRVGHAAVLPTPPHLSPHAALQGNEGDQAHHSKAYGAAAGEPMQGCALAPCLYPQATTSTWTRWTCTPTKTPSTASINSISSIIHAASRGCARSLSSRFVWFWGRKATVVCCCRGLACVASCHQLHLCPSSQPPRLLPVPPFLAPAPGQPHPRPLPRGADQGGLHRPGGLQVPARRDANLRLRAQGGAWRGSCEPAPAGPSTATAVRGLTWLAARLCDNQIVDTVRAARPWSGTSWRPGWWVSSCTQTTTCGSSRWEPAGL